eukprot:GILK01007753.1.p1 GENE.GILK01007753.1~~GILK01007753.1.p1  ORF type:complete len:873 (-),score=128.44 GILK01007753.1:174-2738(-)
MASFGFQKATKTEHPFANSLILKRKQIGFNWDRSYLAIIVPSFNEKDDVKHTVASIRAEMKSLMCLPELKTVHYFFVVDGSGVDQLQTASITLETIVDIITTGTDMNIHVSEGTKKDVEFALNELKQLEDAEVDLKKFSVLRDLYARTVEEKAWYDHKIQSNVKKEIFAQSWNKIGDKYRNYTTRLVEYNFRYTCESGEDHLDFIITLLVKEQNKRKLDSLLLCLHCCLLEDKVPWALGFVDCDTSWKRGALTNMRHFLGEHDEVAAVSGTIRLRNENSTFLNPLTPLQDFSYILSQIGPKEAEHFIGMVTCCPGAFSMMKLEPATDPYSVLPRVTETALSIEDKNMVELGEDRFWTTLLLEKGFSQQTDVDDEFDGTQNTKVSFLRDAVAETDAPSSLIDYILQQRRWINSTNANFVFGLIPKLNKHLCACNRKFIPVLYLYARSFFEQVGYFLSPGIVALFLFTMMCDVGAPLTTAYITTTYVLVVAIFICLVFSSPKQYPLPYLAYVWLTTLGMFVLVILWLKHVVESMIDEPADFSVKAISRRVLLFFSFFYTLILPLVHRTMRRVFVPLWKPLLPIVFLPLQNILLPIFCFLNLADFSWGNKQTEASEGSLQFENQRKAKIVFTTFAVCNWLVFNLRMVGPDILDYLLLVFQVAMICTVSSTLILSLLSPLTRNMKSLWFTVRFKENPSKFPRKVLAKSASPAVPAVDATTYLLMEDEAPTVRYGFRNDGNNHRADVFSDTIVFNGVDFSRVSRGSFSSLPRSSAQVNTTDSQLAAIDRLSDSHGETSSNTSGRTSPFSVKPLSRQASGIGLSTGASQRVVQHPAAAVFLGTMPEVTPNVVDNQRRLSV